LRGVFQGVGAVGPDCLHNRNQRASSVDARVGWLAEERDFPSHFEAVSANEIDRATEAGFQVHPSSPEQKLEGGIFA
jgi:hypothetical protein